MIRPPESVLRQAVTALLANGVLDARTDHCGICRSRTVLLRAGEAVT
jgi:hypothetical protein